MTPDEPVTDPGNALLAPVLARLHTGTVRASDGSVYGVVTIRTTSATVTAYLAAGEVKTWADVLNGLHAQMGAGSLVVPAPGDLPQLDAAMRRARGNANGGP
jgi:hypothetical protein